MARPLPSLPGAASSGVAANSAAQKIKIISSRILRNGASSLKIVSIQAIGLFYGLTGRRALSVSVLFTGILTGDYAFRIHAFIGNRFIHLPGNLHKLIQFLGQLLEYLLVFLDG